MKYILNSAAILIILFFLSCKTSPSTEQINLNIEKHEFKTYNFDDIFSIEKVIYLEETPNSLLSEIIHLKPIRDELFISDSQHGVIYRFSDNGKFINTIGKKGRGPEELYGMINFLVTDSEIIVLDHNKIIKYSHDGAILKETKKPAISFDILEQGENFMIYNTTNSSWDQLMIIDTSLKTISGFSPLHTDQTIFPMAGRSYLFKDENYSFLTYPFSDTIFKIVDRIAEPYFIFGFKEKKLTNYNSLKRGNFNGDLSKYDYSYKDFISYDFLVSGIAHRDKATLLLYNRNSNEITLIDSIKNGPDMINGSSLCTVTLDGTIYWGYTNASANPTFSFIKNDSVNDNPIIILTKIKNQKLNK